MGAIVVDEGSSYGLPPAPVSFTVSPLSSPNGVVATGGGVSAVFTTGARTVAISGLQPRTFTEQKRVGPGTGDSFTRTRSARWGLSPFYGVWSSPVGGVDADWTTDGANGRVLVNTANVSRYTSLRDQNVIDYDAKIKFTTDTMPAGAGNSFALTGSYTDTDNHYRFRVTLTTTGVVQIGIDRVSGGTSTTVAASIQAGTGYTPGQVWVIHANYTPTGPTSAVISCNTYIDGAVEPAGWQRTFTDAATLGAGRIGVRAFTTAGATNAPTFIVSELEITAGRWANPPTVTHSTWVRVLPSVFAGWDNSVRDWLRGAVVDTSPDVLARAMSYVTGAVPVLDPQYGAGRQVMGQARYGPEDPDGSRVEGADWNDYIRTTGHYPALATPTDDINELAQQFCLDCSGFVRMVYGYWGGIPMSLQDSADLNGVNLPRRSVQIGPSGPGVLIAAGAFDGAGVNVPPPLAGLRIGDVVSFDADSADNVAGEESGDVEVTDDHVGIYLGDDGAGNRLYISSRKTVNGPTFSALGGPSYLNGAGTWATSLRHIRRF